MKLFRWIKDNFLFASTLFLLALIPLYPKIPLIDIQNTWVYVRIEDFAVGFVLFVWLILFFRKKITLKTPLTFPIFIFWIVGGIATLHGVMLIFPTMSDVFANVALLSLLRRIEYMSLFFVAYIGMKNKNNLPYVIATLVVVMLVIVAYGFGQRYLGFPAFLTMNEEFAKGIPIQLSELSRVPSTFAGHYDLAAYLVLIIPLLTSLAFGFKRWSIRIILLGTAAFGFALLFMTVSRSSFFVLFLSLIMLLLLQKRRLVIASLFVVTIAFLIISPSLLQRFGSTVTEVDVLIDAKTGAAMGHVIEVPAEYFKDKTVFRESIATSAAEATASASILPYLAIAPRVSLLVDTNNSTGENLPQGTGYINLPLSPVVKRISDYFYEKQTEDRGVGMATARVFYGEFLVKRALAYDLSFTTRFQGEWPRTITAFLKNIFLGSGYGSVSLAVDNNYLRILGELGLLGFISFISIFIVAVIYMKKILPNVDSPIVRSFIFGFVAGSFGLALNAILIDVFEASKIAFTYWLLMGIVIGILHLYKKGDINLFAEFKKTVTSSTAVIIYLLILTVALFSSLYNYFFVGDDFTWLRWVSDCSSNNVMDGVNRCAALPTTIISYFIESNGFFYRPGTKLYFLLMNSAFWLNQTMYHLVSIALHFVVAVLIFLIAKRVIKDYFLAVLSAILFLILSGHSENVFWISSTGFLFNALFALLSLLFFIYWKEKKNIFYFVAAVAFIVCSLLFHELGVVVPLLLILYDVIYGEKADYEKISRKTSYVILLLPLLPYLVIRFISQSHWFNGDYSYNILKLPYNIVGNTMGYLGVDLFGSTFLFVYDKIRLFSRDHLWLAIPLSLVVGVITVWLWRKTMTYLSKDEQKVVIFGSLFFLIALLPFLGLGNITARYSYLSSMGFVIIFALLLKKIYLHLISNNGKYISLACVTLIGLLFCALQLFQLQKIQIDWKEAGEQSKRFIVSLNNKYSDVWTQQKMKFYFVNVPIRNGDAWVFPVGLSDAIWFAFRNSDIEVYQVSSTEEAFSIVTDPTTEKIFEFDGTGVITEKFKPQATTVVPVAK